MKKTEKNLMPANNRGLNGHGEMRNVFFLNQRLARTSELLEVLAGYWGRLHGIYIG